MSPIVRRTGPLPDRIAPGVQVLFVGINPGVRSAELGRHFAGFSNRFWKLLVESQLVPVPIGYQDDDRLPEWGLGLTNIIARPSRGIDDLTPDEYAAGWRILSRKIARYRPRIVALVGVTLYRTLRPRLAGVRRGARTRATAADGLGKQVLGLRPEVVYGARVFVLPNPSGRNANFSHAEMLEAFRALKRYVATPGATS